MILPKTLDRSFFTRVLCWLKGQIVADVPAEDAICEFDCRKQQCSYGEWAACSRRLKYMAKN
jgi:hypothetical protein